MLNEKTKKARKDFMAISVMEHHLSHLSAYSPYDLCEIFATVWENIKKNTSQDVYQLDKDFVMSINKSLTSSLGLEDGDFKNKETWLELINQDIYCLVEDPEHIISWMFSALYWEHLTQLKLITAWLYCNVLRTQLNLPKLQLSQQHIGNFLDSLSGSGPPIHDGQTFFLHHYR